MANRELAWRCRGPRRGLYTLPLEVTLTLTLTLALTLALTLSFYLGLSPSTW